METIVLFCKSYAGDLERFHRLAKSVQRYNVDRLAFWLSVPQQDLQLFEPLAAEYGIEVVTDESIHRHVFDHGKARQPSLPANVLQQVTKSEFWRLGKSRHYVMIDSDSYFIRPFTRQDFLYTDDIPYTVINEGRHVLEFVARKGDEKFLRQYRELREKARNLFQRSGRLYDFAPTPCIWSAAVWEVFDRDFLQPRGYNFYDMIVDFPCETQLYGEFLLSSQVLPLIPVEPLFKTWHFAGQRQEGVALGDSEAVLAENYLGIVSQSNWDSELDTQPRKKRRLKRLLKKLTLREEAR